MEKKTKVFDEKDWEIVTLMKELGFNSDEAKVLVCLAESEETITSREIETVADMSQPMVSTALRSLRKQGLVKRKEHKTPGKGRPQIDNWATMKLIDIVEMLVKRKKNQIEALNKKMDRLRHLSEKVSC